MSSDTDTTERPESRGLGRSREKGGVVELPWPEDEAARSELERRETRETHIRDGRPEIKASRVTETRDPVQRPPQRHGIWRGFWTLVGGLVILGILAALVWWAIRPSQPKISYTLSKPAVATIT